MSRCWNVQRGRGRGSSSADNRRPHHPTGQRDHTTMVRLHSPVSQVSWSGGQTSSSPETDNPVSLTASGNLHGAIGEHRRCSRSSSVSSGGSSSNSSEGSDTARPQTRLGTITAGHAHSHEIPVEQQPVQRCGPASDKMCLAETGKLDKMPQAYPGLKRSSPQTSDQFGGDSADSFGFLMGPQTSMDATKHGRHIMGHKSTANSCQSQEAPPAADLDLLSEPIFSPSHFVANVNQEMEQMGMGPYFHCSKSSENVPLTFEMDVKQLAASFQSSVSANLSAGMYQSEFGSSDNGSGQYPPNVFGRGQRGTRGNHFYSAPGVATAPIFNTSTYYPSGGKASEYMPQQPGNIQTFSSQDFSMPPPAQPWQGPGPESDHKKVTCSLCKQNYKWPHALDCLHVYCFPCLASMFDAGDNSIACPECSSKTALPDGPCALKLDNEVARFMRKTNIFPFNCTSCTRDIEAVTCCTTCVAYLCCECREGHKNMNQFQDHSLSPITKVGKTADGDYAAFCKRHPSECLTRYCCVCVDMVCPVCLPDHIHPEYPNTNGCPTLEEVYPIVVERLNNWNEDAQIKSKDLIELTKQIPLTLQYLDSKRRTIRKQIDEYADYCKTVIDQNRQAAYELLDKTVAQMESDAHAWTATVNKITKELQAVTAFNTRTVKLGSVSDTVDLLDVMESAYKRSMEHYSSVIKNNESIKIDLKFDPNYTDSHALLNQNFMSISYSLNGVEHKVVSHQGSQPSHASKGRSSTVYRTSNAESSDCNYQRWSSAPDSMTISTWNSDRDRKTGTFIAHLNRCRTKTSYTHMFGEYGHGEYAFTEPSGQAYLKDGSYVICDTNNHRIIYYNANHEYVRTIGQPPNLPPVADDPEQRSNGYRGKGFARQDGYLYFPNRVAICPLTQKIIATERPPSHDVQIFTIAGEFVRCFGGNILQHPRGVTVDDEGIIIVVECKVMKLVMFSQDGSFIMSHSLAKDLEFPNDVAAKDKKIFISDNRGHCVQVFNYNAEHLYKIGNESITFFPIGVSINHLNQVVVTDNHNTFNITVFDMSGTVLHIFESVSKLAQCHNIAVHPSSLDLMLTTKDCSVYFFNYDPNVAHPLSPPESRRSAHGGMYHTVARRPRGNGSSVSTHY